jgi:hypothetical protein
MSYERDVQQEPRLAIQCRFLRRTIDSTRLESPVVTLCTHPVRDGFDCVGPFMDDMPTSCGLWELGSLVFASPPR